MIIETTLAAAALSGAAAASNKAQSSLEPIGNNTTMHKSRPMLPSLDCADGDVPGGTFPPT